MKPLITFSQEDIVYIMGQGAKILLTPGLPKEDLVKEVFGSMLLILNQLEKENRLLKK